MSKKVLSIGLLACFIFPLAMGMITPVSLNDLVGQESMNMSAPLGVSGGQIVDEVSSIVDEIPEQKSVVEYEPASDLDMSGEFWDFDENGFTHSVIPMNYRDGGEWNDIDTQIVPRANTSFGDEYSAMCNRNKYSIMFKDDAWLDEYVSVISNIYFGETELQTELTISAMPAYYYNGVSYDYISNSSGDRNLDYGNVALYDLYDGIVERYIVTASGIKHYYVVDELPVTNLSGAVLSIPFGVLYNNIEYSICNDGVEITADGEYDEIDFVSRIFSENAYNLEPIVVVNLTGEIGTGNYYVDYTEGDVIIYANVSYAMMSMVEGSFVIDPVWNVEYTSTGRIESQKYIRSTDVNDWYDFDTIYYGNYTPESYPYYFDNCERVEYVNRPNYPSVGRSVVVSPYNDDYSYIATSEYDFGITDGDRMPDRGVSINGVGVSGYPSNYDDGVSDVYGNSSGYATNCVVMQSRQPIVNLDISISQYPYRFNRHFEYEYNFNMDCINYSDGSYIYSQVVQTMTVGTNNIFMPIVSPLVEFYEYQSPTLSYAYVDCVVNSTHTGYNFWNNNGVNRTYLVEDAWYYAGFENITYSDYNTRGRARYFEYDFTIYNATRELVTSIHCVRNSTVYEFDGTSIIRFSQTGNDGGNSSRFGRFKLDEFALGSAETSHTYKRGYMYTDAISRFAIDAYYGEDMFRYDVFTANVMWPYIPSTPTLYAGKFFVEYSTNGSAWQKIPNTDLPGNAAGFTPYYMYYDNAMDRAVGMFVISVAFLDIDVYEEIRFLWVTDRSPYAWGATFLTQFDLWYVKGDDSMISANPLTTYDIDNYVPVDWYADDDETFSMTSEYSLFGSFEPLAGTRMYYFKDNGSGYPGPMSPMWVQITDDIYMYDDNAEEWVLFNGDYDYIPTDSVLNPYTYAVNENKYVWYPEESVPEGTYWFKFETINSGYTLKMVVIGGSSDVDYNTAPTVVLSTDISSVGRDFINLNVFDEGSYDDGGNDNIVSYTYNITSDLYNYVAIKTVSGFNFTLPDDGVYVLNISLEDSMGAIGYGEVNITNYNANPRLTAAYEYTDSDDTELISATPAVGDTFIFDFTTSFDEDGRIVRYDVDYGDGFNETIYPGYLEGITISYVYVKEGSYVVNVTAVDDDIGSTSFYSRKTVGNYISGTAATDATSIRVSSDGIPVVANIEEVKDGSRYDWVGEYLIKESVSIIIEKNPDYADWVEYRSFKDRTFDEYETESVIVADILYYDSVLVWKPGAKFFTDVYVFGIAENEIDLLSVDLFAELNSATAEDEGIQIDVDSNWEKIIIVTNPGLWMKAKVLFGARGLDAYKDVTSEAVAINREDFEW